MFKPLLAATCEDTSQLVWPMIATPKLDGIRAMVIDGQLVSRTMKPIPNDYVREWFSQSAMEKFDGELILGDPTDPKCFNVTTSAVMRKGVIQPDVKFHVFDDFTDPTLAYHCRMLYLDRRLASAQLAGLNCVKVPYTVLNSLAHLVEYETAMVEQGYEGVMLRHMNGPYKFGRSTEKEQTLLKVKRFVDDEAVILDVIEGQHNANAAEKDAFGRTKRSSAKAGQVPNGQLGALRVCNTVGQEFNIGTGFDANDHKVIWLMHTQLDQVIGRTVKYRYQSAGMKDLPRFPSFVGFRED